MKTTIFSLLAFVSLLSFTNCGNDDDGATVQNNFTYDGTTYALSRGFLNDVGANFSGTHDYDVFLTSSEINASGASLLGEGELIYLDLNTAEANGLEDGTYNWSTTREALTVVPGTEVFTEYNLTVFTGNRANATAGSVTISTEGNETTIRFNLTLSDGNTAIGEWRGVLQDI